MIFVSHSLDQVTDVCDRAMWLERGYVKALGPAPGVLAAYQSEHGSGEH